MSGEVAIMFFFGGLGDKAKAGLFWALVPPVTLVVGSREGRSRKGSFYGFIEIDFRAESFGIKHP